MAYNKDILIIDDSLATAKLLEEFLKEIGYTDTHIYTDAETAMIAFSRYHNANITPLVFLDYYLPGTDTISLFKQMIKMEPEIKIIIITVAEKEEPGIKYLTQHGAYHYIQKPFSLNNIKEIMETFEKEQSALGK